MPYTTVYFSVHPRILVVYALANNGYWPIIGRVLIGERLYLIGEQVIGFSVSQSIAATLHNQVLAFRSNIKTFQ